MIHGTEPRWQHQTWQAALADSVTDIGELCQLLDLDADALPISLDAHKQFSLRVPRYFISLMQAGNADDPLLRQVLPIKAELEHQVGFVQDPLQERGSNPVPGVIHKYHGRVLFIISKGCAINCRYCFRRHFPYSDNNPSTQEWQQAINYIANDPSITEVIFSGGDPLAAPDKKLNNLVQQLADIPHLRRLRIHTRLPVVLPQRVTSEMIEWLTHTRLEPVIVLHANHSQEISPLLASKVKELTRSGIPVLNQTVLLKGINDSSNTLKQLSETLFSAGALPYYLHLLDKVEGASQFETTEKQAKALIEDLIMQLPGYLVPKLVKEEANMASKTPL